MECRYFVPGRKLEDGAEGGGLGAGPKLKFHKAAVVALAGASFTADVDGLPLPMYTAVNVPVGATLSIHTVPPARGPPPFHPAL